MIRNRLLIALTLAATALGSVAPLAAQAADSKLLNVSYDPTRELYQDFNTAFGKYWQKKGGGKESIHLWSSPIQSFRMSKDTWDSSRKLLHALDNSSHI